MIEFFNLFKNIIEKISNFFDIFDLSFIVSGFTTISSLFILDYFLKTQFIYYFQIWNVNIVIKIIILSFSCYITGLICFCLGRLIRSKTRKNYLDKLIENSMKNHSLDKDIFFEKYFTNSNIEKEKIWSLYSFLWAELRQSSNLNPSLNLLNRFWVMAATYDGLGASLIIWILIIIYCCYSNFHIYEFISIVILALMSFFSFRESNRYLEDQIETLISTIAYKRNKVNTYKNNIKQIYNKLDTILDSNKKDDSIKNFIESINKNEYILYEIDLFK